jgi:hypothetical protein
MNRIRDDEMQITSLAVSNDMLKWATIADRCPYCRRLTPKTTRSLWVGVAICTALFGGALSLVLARNYPIGAVLGGLSLVGVVGVVGSTFQCGLTSQEAEDWLNDAQVTGDLTEHE